MEQRSLRLGDFVDDYCPRERRVTNHAIVAIVDESIRQTRCTTCEAEHEYKEARMPKKKLKDGETPNLAGGVLVAPKPGNGHATDITIDAPPAQAAASDSSPSEPLVDDPATASANPNGEEERQGAWGHRQLIRATLPRTESDQPTPRAIPEFTMHQRQGRGFGGGGGRGFRPYGFGGRPGGNGGGGHIPRDGEPDGNRAPRPGGGPGGGGPGGGQGKSRHRRRHRRPRP